MRFVCRYCRCYWNLTAPALDIDRDEQILAQVVEIQNQECPTMMKHISHSLFGEIDGRVLDA